jgi:hypothetical protein
VAHYTPKGDVSQNGSVQENFSNRPSGSRTWHNLPFGRFIIFHDAATAMTSRFPHSFLGCGDANPPNARRRSYCSIVLDHNKDLDLLFLINIDNAHISVVSLTFHVHGVHCVRSPVPSSIKYDPVPAQIGPASITWCIGLEHCHIKTKHRLERLTAGNLKNDGPHNVRECPWSHLP